jgi:hypothetical protein
MVFRRIVVFVGIALSMLGTPLFAQTGGQVSTSTRSSGSSSILTPKEGKAAKKRSKVKRGQKGYSSKSGLFSKKSKSDCDCPGSPKAQRKKRRR